MLMLGTWGENNAIRRPQAALNLAFAGIRNKTLVVLRFRSFLLWPLGNIKNERVRMVEIRKYLFCHYPLLQR